MDWGGTKLLSARQRVQKNSSMDRAIYWEVLRKNLENLDRGDLCQEVLRFYWAYRNKVFQGGKTTLDECNQDRHQTKQQRSMLSSKTHQQL